MDSETAETSETKNTNIENDDAVALDAEGGANPAPVGDGENLDAEGGPAEKNGEGEDDEIVVTIGDEPPPVDEDENRAPPWVRDLRKTNRELTRVVREREAEISRLKGAPGGGQTSPVVVGEKPTFEGCGFDDEKFERELEAWHTRKRAVDDQAAKKQAEENEQRKSWQTRLDAYSAAKSKLRVRDFDDAEAMVQEVFNVTQQGVIINGAENPAMVIYALGKNPKKAKELAAITDPVKFAFAAAKLEEKLKVTPRKSAPPPERVVQSSVAGAAAVDNQLERLRADAAKTGDMSKISAYRRQLKEKQRQAA